jgi:hypothetical protein
MEIINLGPILFITVGVLVLLTAITWTITFVIGNYFSYSYYKKFKEVESSIKHLDDRYAHPSKFFFVFTNECKTILKADRDALKLRSKYICCIICSILLPTLAGVLMVLGGILIKFGII